MDKHLQQTFLLEIDQQCEQVYIAFNSITDILSRPSQTSRATMVFYSVQQLVCSTANISKLLWGAGGSKATQRKALRDAIGISDTSPLRNVDARNNFEHLDERIDRWWSSKDRNVYVSRNIGPRTMFANCSDISIFHLLDPQTLVLTFWGQQFDLPELVREVQAIHQRVRPLSRP